MLLLPRRHAERCCHAIIARDAAVAMPMPIHRLRYAAASAAAAVYGAMPAMPMPALLTFIPRITQHVALDSMSLPSSRRSHAAASKSSH